MMSYPFGLDPQLNYFTIKEWNLCEHLGSPTVEHSEDGSPLYLANSLVVQEPKQSAKYFNLRRKNKSLIARHSSVSTLVPAVWCLDSSKEHLVSISKVSRSVSESIPAFIFVIGFGTKTKIAPGTTILSGGFHAAAEGLRLAETVVGKEDEHEPDEFFYSLIFNCYDIRSP
ncbi:hypothetical protein STEG23_020359 [Scotinomys teguina]